MNALILFGLPPHPMTGENHLENPYIKVRASSTAAIRCEAEIQLK
jgi:hypothetical protein